MNLTVLFGANETYLDVTDICKRNAKNGIITIPRNDHNRTFQFSDPLYGVLKHIILKNGDREFICDENTEVAINSDNSNMILSKPYVKIIYGVDCDKLKILFGKESYIDVTDICKERVHNNIVSILSNDLFPEPFVGNKEIVLLYNTMRIPCDSHTNVKINMLSNTIFLSKRLGFIMLRHVNNAITSNYWEHSYDCIRKFYPDNMIVIIDDNSNYKFIKNKEIYNTVIIQSEYKGRGELLPYIYFLKTKYFEDAFIIHDSVFLNAPIHYNVNCAFIWNFDENIHPHFHYEKKMLQNNDNGLLELHKSKKWDGCFGCMTMINHGFLLNIQNKFNFEKLIPFVTTKDARCAFERVLSIVLTYYGACEPPLLGNIHNYCPWGVKYHQIHNYSHLPIIKVWSGR